MKLGSGQIHSAVGRLGGEQSATFVPAATAPIRTRFLRDGRYFWLKLPNNVAATSRDLTFGGRPSDDASKTGTGCEARRWLAKLRAG